MATTDRAALDIKFKNIDQIRSSLDKKLIAMKDRGNALHQAVIVVDRWVIKNFESEGQLAYPGQGWKPLARSTIEGKERAWGKAMKGKGYTKSGLITKKLANKIAGNKILQDRGWLRSRWKRYWNNEFAIVQSAVDYGIYHDSDAPRKHLPERKILPTDKQILPQLRKLFNLWIRTNLSKR
jgi:phage gpG-like protein